MQGLFDLNTSEDLYSKLEWEYDQLVSNPNSEYIAFNFFVTAWHLLEWKHPDPEGRNVRNSIRNNEPILQVCEHLAVGAKHFSPTSNKHTSVKSSGSVGAWGGSWGNAWGKSWGSNLVVRLNEDHHEIFGEQISVNKLADLIMDYWRQNK